MKTKMTPARQLWFGSTDSKPVDFDWSNGYAETWEFWEARENEAGEIVGNWDDTDSHFERPMMNYYYSMPTFDGDPQDAAKTLAHLPLCVVRIEDADCYGLALTGGGMDLSWEICEAFMRLGYLPPVHFCSLPAMAGRGTSARDRWIISGCRRSLQGQKQAAGRALRSLRENFKAVCA